MIVSHSKEVFYRQFEDLTPSEFICMFYCCKIVLFGFSEREFQHETLDIILRLWNSILEPSALPSL